MLLSVHISGVFVKGAYSRMQVDSIITFLAIILVHFLTVGSEDDRDEGDIHQRLPPASTNPFIAWVEESHMSNGYFSEDGQSCSKGVGCSLFVWADIRS